MNVFQTAIHFNERYISLVINSDLKIGILYKVSASVAPAAA